MQKKIDPPKIYFLVSMIPSCPLTEEEINSINLTIFRRLRAEENLLGFLEDDKEIQEIRVVVHDPLK